MVQEKMYLWKLWLLRPAKYQDVIDLSTHGPFDWEIETLQT